MVIFHSYVKLLEGSYQGRKSKPEEYTHGFPTESHQCAERLCSLKDSIHRRCSKPVASRNDHLAPRCSEALKYSPWSQGESKWSIARQSSRLWAHISRWVRREGEGWCSYLHCSVLPTGFAKRFLHGLASAVRSHERPLLARPMASEWESRQEILLMEDKPWK